LSNDAGTTPPQEPAAPQALPASQAGVPPAAGPPDGFIEKDRYNGLQASHQRALALLREAGIDPATGQRQTPPPAAQPPAAPAPTAPAAAAPAAPQPGTDDFIRQGLELLLAERMNDRYQAALVAATAAYPRVVPVQDRLSGDTAEAILEDAKRMDIALGGDGVPAGGTPPVQQPPATEPGTLAPTAAGAAITTPVQVSGGSPGAPPAPPTEDPREQLRQLIAAPGNMESKMDRYLKLKQANPGVSLLPEVFSSWDRSGASEPTEG